MLDAPSNAKTLAELTVGIPGAGRRTLLDAMAGLAETRLPANFRLCVLDAERLRAPAQVALLDELAADPALEPLFVLNKADKITGPRTIVTRTLTLLRERGFQEPRLYPVCAAAAKVFRLPANAELHPKQLAAQGEYYFRYSPGENSLSAFAFTGPITRPLGSREVSPHQLSLAILNTGVPALEAELEALALREAEDERRTAEAGLPAGTGTVCPPEADQDAALREPGSEAAEQTPPAQPSSEAEGPAEPEPAPESEEAEAPLSEPEPEAPAAEVAAEPDPVPEGGEAETAAPPAEPEAPEAPGRGETAPENPDQAPPAADGQPEMDPVEKRIDAFLELLDQPEEPAPADDASAESGSEPGPETGKGTDGRGEGLFLFDVPQTRKEAKESLTVSYSEPDFDPEAILAMAETADCAGLLALADKVQKLKAPNESREQVLSALHASYIARQSEELDKLTQGAESLDLAGLRALTDRITGGAYTVQARGPYVERLNRRADELQVQALEELCAGVEEADLRGLAQIWESLEQVDCAEILKSEFFRRIDARQEALDLEALDRVTAAAETMSEKELRAVAVTLEAGNWNPKYIAFYRHKIELCREAALFREASAELEQLDDMERRELLALRERISQKELPRRFTAAPLARIDQKLYRMDMLRLMALNNDFDRLDFDGIDELRARILRGDYSQQARKEYLDRLLRREEALVLENTDARAQLARQLIGQHKLRMVDFCFASQSEDYRERLAAFWGGSGMEQPRDIPVFLLDNASDYALSRERFYYKIGRELAFVPVAEIARLQVMRQHMSLLLQIVRKDNSYLLTAAKLGRNGTERTLAFLNDCIRRWNEPGVADMPSAKPIPTPCFEIADYIAPVPQYLPDEKLALKIFRERCAAEKLREGSLIREGEDGWESRTRRLLVSFGLPENTPLIWYCSTTLLGSVREGVALGPRALYQKENKLPTVILPLEEITGLTRNGKQVTVSTLRNQSYRMELPGSMVSPVEDYIKAIQLGAYLRSREETL